MNEKSDRLDKFNSCLFFKWEVGRLLYLCDCKSNPPFTVPPLKEQVSFCFDNTVR